MVMGINLCQVGNDHGCMVIIVPIVGSGKDEMRDDGGGDWSRGTLIFSMVGSRWYTYDNLIFSIESVYMILDRNHSQQVVNEV